VGARWAGDDVVVLLNFANRGYESYRIGLPRAGTWRVRFNSDWSGYSPDFSDWDSFDATAHGGGRMGYPSTARSVSDPTAR